MNIYAVDFGNANTSIASMDTSHRPPRPRLLPHATLGFSYDDGPPALIPTCIYDNEREGTVLIGQPARAKPGHTTDLKEQLHQNSAEAKILCTRFFAKLFAEFNIPFSDPSIRVIFTRPSYSSDEQTAKQEGLLRSVLAGCIPNFDELVATGRIAFCDEAMAVAIGYRVFENSRIARKDVLCLDVGSFSADAAFFSADNFEQVQRSGPLNVRRATTATAGRLIDRWIEEALAAQKIEWKPQVCERVKLALSRGSSLETTPGLEAAAKVLKTPEMLLALLHEKGFFEELAKVCIEVLPDEVKTNETRVKALTLLFTGGSSLLPDFGRRVHHALWVKLFDAATERPRAHVALARAHQPLKACVTGGLWWSWLKSEGRYIPILDQGYAIKLFRRPEPPEGEPAAEKSIPLLPENIPFLEPGEDISRGVQRSYRLIPAHAGQRRFRIEIIALDGRVNHEGNPPPLGFVEGELENRNSILLTLKMEPPDRLAILIDGASTTPIYLSGQETTEESA